MNLKQLQYFTAVVQTGSISAAAKMLHISQPPLSTQLRLLEEELGATLFERGARSIRLTDAGRTLYTRAQSILDLTETAVKEVRDIGSGLSGTLSIGTISSSGTALLHHRIPEFNRLYPDVRFEIYEGNTYELIEKLSRGIIEIAIVRTPFQNDGYECLYLNAEPMAAVGDAGYFPDSGRDAVSLRDLKDAPLIYYRRFEPLIGTAFAREGLTPVVLCKNDDARTSLLWANAGLGVALVPLSITPAIRSENLTLRIIDSPALITRIAAIRKSSQYHSVVAERFFACFRNSGSEVMDPGII